MKLYLAGYQGSSHMLPGMRPLYVLESYHNIREKKLLSNDILLDSGAFTFMTSRKNDEVNFEEYVNEYADFINKYDIKLFFELDVDHAVGLKEVERLRKILEDKTHKKCIPVWHLSRGVDYFKKMCEEYDYVALGGMHEYRSNIKFLEYMIDIAHKNNCKIHGLGYTSLKYLDKLKFDSVDSTSYTSGSRFGTIYKFNGTGMDTKHVGKDFGRRVGKGKTQVINRHNLIEWIKFQHYADKFL